MNLLLLLSCWVFFQETQSISPDSVVNSLVPAGFPQPRVPVGLSDEKIQLGRALFYEGRLAIDGKTSCGSCHIQALAFTDGRSTAIGATFQRHSLATMSLTNVAYNASLTWANPAMTHLETQALVPLFNQSPVEMGLEGRLPEVLAMLASDDSYQSLFQVAFPDQPWPTLEQMTEAIASFQRTFLSFKSPFDALMMQDAQIPNRAEVLRGMSLFFSDALNCSKCHGGYNFSGPVVDQNEAGVPSFHHNGLLGQGPYQDEQKMAPGLAAHTGQARDWGKFRAPTLRNIAVTAPYMHNGMLATLDDVINHYQKGGQDRPYEGIAGKDHPNKSPFIKPFNLSGQQRRDLIAFLHSLTDLDFLTREDLGPPRSDCP